MTVRELVNKIGKSDLKIYQQFELFLDRNNKQTVYLGSTCWAVFQAHIKNGNWEIVKNLLPEMQLAYEQAKRSYKLYTTYKGEKKIIPQTFFNTHITLADDGVLRLNEFITPASLLKMSRLLRDANARCAKHPSNANVGL